MEKNNKSIQANVTIIRKITDIYNREITSWYENNKVSDNDLLVTYKLLVIFPLPFRGKFDVPSIFQVLPASCIQEISLKKGQDFTMSSYFISSSSSFLSEKNLRHEIKTVFNSS